MGIKLGETHKSAQFMERLTGELLKDSAKWAPGLAGKVSGGWFPGEDKIILYVQKGASVAAWQKAASTKSQGAAVEVRELRNDLPPEVTSAESRLADNPR